MDWRKATPWMLIIFAGVFTYYLLADGNSHKLAIRDLNYSELITQIDEGHIHDVTISGNKVSGHFQENNREFETYIPSVGAFVEQVKGKKVQVEARPPEENSFWSAMFINLLPVFLFFGLWVWMSRRVSGRGGLGGPMGMGKSKAKLLAQEDINVTFDDVAGVDEAKEDLQEVVEFLSAPNKFQAVGGKIPKGVLLVGPPGTGKTLLAKAVAGEAGVPFFHLSGSDFVEMFVGVGASRVRDMFDQAKENSPCNCIH